MTATMTNGKPARKQLSDQLDRLDGVIDALAEGLPGAVADATREGARQAVRDVILELLANPELRAMIAGAVPPAPDPIPASPAPPRPGVWTRLKAAVVAARNTAAGRCAAAVVGVAASARTLAAVMPVRKILLVGTGVGLAVGVLCYACPHGLSALVSGVGGACTAIGVQAAHWVRRSTRMLGFGGTS